MSSTAASSIFIADDDDVGRKLLVTHLRRAGFTTHDFPDGKQALEAMRTAGAGIIIADWMMPGMDGVELCQALRELCELGVMSQVYFILLTAHSEKEMIVRGLEAGANDYLTKPYHRQELLARVRAGQRIYELQNESYRRRMELEQKNAELDVLAQRLERLANTDDLTGAYNRRSISAQGEMLCGAYQSEGVPFCCLMIDVDHFKRFNDQHGHEVGDRVLMHVAVLARVALRSCDLFGRWGGEEFITLAPRTTVTEAAEIAAKFQRVLQSSPIVIDGRGLIVSTSIGVAQCAPGQSFEQVVREADRLMYCAKEAGRAQVWLRDETGESRRWAPHVLESARR